MYKVDAQTAGEELERIANKGELTPQNIVDESRSEDAVLHGCFDWNDETAATSWRKQQARTLIDNLVTVEVCGEATPETTRAFVHIQGNYKPMSVVVTAKEYSDEMLEKALRELRMFQNKYSTLKQLADVFASIDRALKAS